MQGYQPSGFNRISSEFLINCTLVLRITSGRVPQHFSRVSTLFKLQITGLRDQPSAFRSEVSSLYSAGFENNILGVVESSELLVLPDL